MCFSTSRETKKKKEEKKKKKEKKRRNAAFVGVCACGCDLEKKRLVVDKKLPLHRVDMYAISKNTISEIAFSAARARTRLQKSLVHRCSPRYSIGRVARSRIELRNNRLMHVLVKGRTKGKQRKYRSEVSESRQDNLLALYRSEYSYTRYAYSDDQLVARVHLHLKHRIKWDVSHF